MNNIGLIDDKDASRRAFMLKINLLLEKNYPNWKIIDSKPFREKEDYRQWILENEISVLIVDERLDEEKLEDGEYANYFGSDLVKDLRNYFKDIPIYCLTNIEITDRLKSSLSYFNLILSRSKFDADIDNYLNLFIKSGVSFYTEYRSQLNRIGVISEIIAEGKASSAEIEEIHALQTTLLIPHLTEDLESREKYQEELQNAILEIKNHQERLVNFLEKK